MRDNTRNSSFELLRIICMLFVLILHVNLAVGISADHSIVGHLQAETESLAIVAVNVFVMISGWFSIKSEKKLFSFICQCIFYSSICLLVGIALGTCKSFKTELITFLCFDWNWFVISYLFLLLLAPILNSYFERAERLRVRRFIVFYFLFSFLLGFFSNAAEFLRSGYSVAFFVPLYCLSRYCNLYRPRFCGFSKKVDLLIFFLCSIINTCMFQYRVPVDCFSYCNPIVVIQSLYLLLFFSKLNILSGWVNRLAQASFPVYLLHLNSHIFEPIYKNYCKELLSSQCPCLIILYIATWFLIAFVIERFRQSLFDLVVSKGCPNNDM